MCLVLWCLLTTSAVLNLLIQLRTVTYILTTMEMFLAQRAIEFFFLQIFFIFSERGVFQLKNIDNVGIVFLFVFVSH